MRRLTPPQVIISSFLITIVIGAILLSLPQSAAEGSSISTVDAFFTATSATCVTGLIVKDTGKDFSKFGQMVILFLIQIGGLGIMTLSTFFAIVFGRKLTLRENVVVKGAMDHNSVEGLKTLILYIFGITFSIEAIGAFFLYNRFGDTYSSIFHAISGFCNAGFSLNTSNFLYYGQDTYVNLIMASLVILGGIGFIVLIDVPKIFKWVFGRVFLGKTEELFWRVFVRDLPLPSVTSFRTYERHFASRYAPCLLAEGLLADTPARNTSGPRKAESSEDRARRFEKRSAGSLIFPRAGVSPVI